MRTTFFVILLAGSTALAQVPGTLGYAGRLLKSNGAPETGTQQFTFAIYGAETGGAALWTENQTLLLANDGLYSTMLGAATLIPSSVWTTNGSRWLEVGVGGTSLSPRQAVGSVAFAQVAKHLVGGAIDASSIKLNGIDVFGSTGKLAGSALPLGAGLVLDGANALSLKSCASQGQVLTWDATASSWVCSSATGPQGATGLTGAIGATGSTGATGATGASPWVQNANDVYYTIGNVGVGTANPASRLQVHGIANDTPSTTNASLYLTAAGQGYGMLLGTSLSYGFSYIQTTVNGSPSVPASSIALSLNPTGGNVGIGTTSATDKLTVVGGGVTAPSFTTSTAWTYVTAGTGWTQPTGTANNELSCRRIGSFLQFKGAMSGASQANWCSVPATLPLACRPSAGLYYLVASCWNSPGTLIPCTVMLFTNGNVQVCSNAPYGYFSMTGSYPAD